MEEPIATVPSRLGDAGVRLRAFARAHAALLLILAAAAIVGFWRLPSRGSVFIDEGYQHLEGVWVKAKLSYVLRHPGIGFNARHFALDHTAGLAPVYAKPLHTLLIAIALRVLPGGGPTPVLVMEGLFGLGTIALVYAIADRLAGRAAAIMSAALLASSSLFLAYRRSGLPEMDSVFFFALAVHVLVRAGDTISKRRAFATGALAGCCFIANDRWYLALPLVGLMLIVLHPKRSSISRAALMVPGFALPVLLAQAASELPLLAARVAHVQIAYKSYFARLVDRDRYILGPLNGRPRLGQIADAPYVGYLHSYEGLIWVVAIVALLVAAVRMRREHGVAFIWAVIPFVFACASPLTAPRFISLGLPGIALAAGMGALRSRTLGRIVICVAVLSSVLHVPAVEGIRAHWSDALAVARDGKILSTKGYSLATYVGTERVVLGFQDSIEWARKRRHEGARWLLLELFCLPGTPKPNPDCSTIFERGELSTYFMRAGHPLVAEHFRPLPFLYEGMAGRAHPEQPSQERFILLYDLRELP